MQRFKALVASKGDNGPDVAWKELGDGDLMDGDVLVRVSHSTINYKDGLALTGKAPVIRRWPMIPGIDFAGTVISSTMRDFKAGDAVILNGWGCGETHLGAYAQVARVKGDWLVPKPAQFTAAETMAIGTAGYTAMLCVLALERNGVTPAQGPGGGDRRRRRRRQRRHRAAGEARLPGDRLDRARRRKPTISRASAPARSSTAPNCRGPPGRSARSAGRAASMRWAATRWRTC